MMAEGLGPNYKQFLSPASISGQSESSCSYPSGAEGTLFTGVPVICSEDNAVTVDHTGYVMPPLPQSESNQSLDSGTAMDDFSHSIAVNCKCPCGRMDFSHILNPPPDCLANRHSDSRNFPELDMKSSKDKKLAQKQLKMELEGQTRIIKQEFRTFGLAVYNYAKSIPDIESILMEGLSLDRKVVETSDFKSLYPKFREGADFINFDILLHCLTNLKSSDTGGEENELRHLAEEAAEKYEASFQEYAQQRVVLVPTILQDPNVRPNSMYKELKIKVEEDFQNFPIRRLTDFKKVLKRILKFPPGANLWVTSVREGCVEICFETIGLHADTHLSLNDVQKQEMLANNITLLEYDGQVSYCCCELVSDESSRDTIRIVYNSVCLADYQKDELDDVDGSNEHTLGCPCLSPQASIENVCSMEECPSCGIRLLRCSLEYHLLQCERSDSSCPSSSDVSNMEELPCEKQIGTTSLYQSTPILEMKNLSSKEQIKASHGQRQQKTTPEVDALLARLLTVCGSGTELQLLELLKDTHIINQKIKGTTLLHESCYHGNLECVKALMKAGACPTIWDVRGFTPAHSAAYNNHLSSLQVVLDFNPPSTTNSAKATPNTLSKDKESLLHITCFRGHLKLALFLVSREANLGATDCHGNSVLHYAAGSDSGVLVKWLIDQLSEEVENAVNARNKFGQTPAHRASVLGCPSSLSVLIHYAANLSIQDNDGYTPVDLARLMCKTSCYDIGCDVKKAYSLPSTPPPYSGSISKSMDNLSSSQSLSVSGGRLYLPQRSLSNASYTLPLLQRQPSITGAQRPRNLSIIRRGSLMSKGLSLTSVDDASMYVTKTTALQVRSSFKHKKSKSWDITQQLLYNSTAYEPPPDILFVSPVHKTTISHKNPRFFSGAHDIKIRILPEHWSPQTLPPNPSKLDPTPPAQPPSIDLCVCAAMHLNQPFEFPPGYTIVSPVYFISFKTPRPCQVELTLPHVVAYTKDEEKKRLCILSTTTVNPNLRDVWSPSNRTLTELEMDSFEVDMYRVKFRTSLVHPSLYAVAVNERDFSLEPHLPLRCSLYISYPVLEPTASVSGLYVTSYVGMKLKTVYTAVTNQTTENKSKYEEKHFTLSGDSVRVDAGLTNQSNEWVMTSRDSGEFTYNQLALTQETDKDSYSHTPAYPPHTAFFVEPRGVAAAVRCKVKLLSGDGTEISYIQVIPFSPCRELTPPPNHLTKSYVPPPHFTLAQSDHPDTPVTNV